MLDVCQHITTTNEISVLTGKCPVCGYEIDPKKVDEKGLVKCDACRYPIMIPVDVHST